MRYVDLVRVYDCPHSPTISASDVPEELVPWIGSRAVTDEHVCFYELPAVELSSIDTSTRCSLQRWILYFPQLQIAEIHAWSRDETVPVSFSEQRWTAFDTDRHDCGALGQLTVYEMFDASLVELLGLEGVAAIEVIDRTFFGVVEVTNQSSPPPAAFTAVSIPSSVFPNESVMVGRNCLRVDSSATSNDGQEFFAYLVVAGHAVKTRHCMNRLVAMVGRLAEDPTLTERSPWKNLRRSIELQRRAILVRQAATGSAYLGDQRLHRFFADAKTHISLAKYEAEAFERSLDGLNQLSSGLLSLGIDASQGRLAYFGIAFAAGTLIFAAASGVLDFSHASDERVWILLAWMAIVLVFGAIWVLVSLREKRAR